MIGVTKPFVSYWIEEKHKERKKRKEKEKKFNEIIKKMPELIADMKKYLEKPDNQFERKFFITGTKTHSFPRKDSLVLYFEEHEYLNNKIDLLIYSGYIKDISPKNIKRFEMIEEFYELVLKS